MHYHSCLEVASLDQLADAIEDPQLATAPLRKEAHEMNGRRWFNFAVNHRLMQFAAAQFEATLDRSKFVCVHAAD